MSNDIVLAQAVSARDQDTWHAHMEQALAGLNCRVMQSTSDAAPGLLAYVEPHLGAHHSPDLCHVQHALSKAVSAPHDPRAVLLPDPHSRTRCRIYRLYIAIQYHYS